MSGYKKGNIEERRYERQVDVEMIRWERSVSVKELIVVFSGTTVTDIRIMN